MAWLILSTNVISSTQQLLPAQKKNIECRRFHARYVLTSPYTYSIRQRGSLCKPDFCLLWTNNWFSQIFCWLVSTKVIKHLYQPTHHTTIFFFNILVNKLKSHVSRVNQSASVTHEHPEDRMVVFQRSSLTSLHKWALRTLSVHKYFIISFGKIFLNN